MREIAARRTRFRWWWRLGEWLGLLAFGLVVFALLPRIPGGVLNEIRARFGASLLTGFVILAAAPVAAIVMLISIVGIALAGALGLLWLLTCYSGQLVAAACLGERGLTERGCWSVHSGDMAVV